jgi:hypothetical protein
MADRSGTPWDRFPAQAQAGDQVSKNFQLYELTRSELAQRLRIDNSFAAIGELRAAVNVCREVESTSQHCAGEAADVEIPGMATLELARRVERNLKFDQLICECYDPRQVPQFRLGPHLAEGARHGHEPR